MKSIRSVITVAFLSLILLQAGGLWLLSRLSYHEVADQLSNNFNQELAGRINDRLAEMIKMPAELNQIEKDAINLGLIDFNDEITVNQYFWRNLQTFPLLNATFIGTSDGDMFGARHSPEDETVYEVMQSIHTQGGDLRYFSTDENGEPVIVIEHADSYDPRERSWYINAVEKNGLSWSPIYLDYSTQALVITAAEPVYDDEGKLVGVIGSAFKFTEVQNFLQSLDVGETGITFLVEEDGLLISTSTDDPLLLQDESTIERINITDSGNPLIEAAVAYIEETYQGLGNISDSQFFDLNIDGNGYFGYILPINDPYGINWVSITIIPEADFLSKVDVYNHVIVILTLAIILLTIMAALYISKRFTDPIIELSKAAHSYSEGDWESPINIERRNEFRVLAESLMDMRNKTRRLISDLNSRVSELHDTHEYLDKLISTANIMIVGLDKYGQVRMLNKSGERTTGYTFKELEGVKWFEKIVPRDQFPEVWDAFQTYQQKKGNLPITFENPILTKSGEKRIIFWQNSTVLSPDKEISTISFGIDITDQRLIEEKLHESEERIRLTLETAKIGNWDWDLINDVWYASPTYYTMLGYDPEEGPGNRQVWLDRVHPEDRELVIETIQEAQSRNFTNYQYEARMRYADGTYRWLFVQGFVIKRDVDGKPTRMLGIRIDINDKKNAEKALQEAEIRYRTLVERVPAIIYTGALDETASTLYISPQVESLLGFSQKEWIEKPDLWANQLHPTDRKRVLDEFKKCRSQGIPLHVQYRMIHKNGDIVWFRDDATIIKDKNGNLICTQGIMSDITGQIQIEQKLRESEERYLASQAIGHVGDWEYNIQTTQFWGSDEAKRIYGFDPQQDNFTTEEVENCIPERERVHKALTDLIEKDKPYDLTFEIKPKDSSTSKIIISKAKLLRGEDNQPLKVVGVIQDITEIKYAEDEIRKLNLELEQRVRERTAQLEAANKELGAFAYSVSHDLRAPLRHIDGFLELLSQRIEQKLDDKSRHYMEIISNSSKRMGKLIDDLLSFSSMGRLELAKRKVNLNELIQDVIQEFKPDLENRKINWSISDLPAVIGDKSMLRIVLVNLISNAIKFTKNQKIADIEIGCSSESKNETIIYIRDNGVGFNMDYADNLFGVFQRLHNIDEFEGTGIGLATIRRIINRHNGRTWAEAEQDQGATFYFSLPTKV